MNTMLTRALWGTLLAGGITLAGGAAANAVDLLGDTTGEDGLLSGTQAVLNVDLPVTIGGNALSVIGDASSVDAVTEAPAAESAPVEAVTSGQDGVGGGSQAIVDVHVPVTVGGNAVSVIGDATTIDAGTGTDAASAAPVAEEPAAEPVADAPVVGVTDGSDSLLGGTQILAPITAPVTAGGNAISVIGDATTVDSTTTGGTHGNGHNGDGLLGITNGSDSILGGTQILAPITAPVTAGGNAISVIGDATTVDSTTPSGTHGTGHNGDGLLGITNGSDSILGGTQILAPITAPLTADGNAISVIGDATTVDSTTPSGTHGTGH
ncbi:hypothetical protein ABXJ56_06580, partial [Microbacterium chocolatum]|uniref:hypothetical protein n=1 Tax=Microbacterium aurantiacum TaxID=162393 RepID=UPI00338EC790